MIAARIFRQSERDALVLAAALTHGVLLTTGLAIAARGGAVSSAVAVAILALAMCWGSNTVSHIHLHRPLFRGDRANRAFLLYLTVLLAVPQTWWRRRHLQHHGLAPMADDRATRGQILLEAATLTAAFAIFAILAPSILLTVYVPMLALGLGMCALQGRGEHARADDGVDHRGRVYNLLWFNDGFHAAHHRHPETHWTQLPAHRAPTDIESPWPPVLRFIERLSRYGIANHAAAALLDVLERTAGDLALVQRFLVRSHRRAFEALIPAAEREALRQVTIVGGGLFPRTALVLATLLPHARITIIDADAKHLEQAREILAARSGNHSFHFVHERYDGATFASACDLLVLPLAFRGDRAGVYARPPAHRVAVHDWIWRAAGSRSVRVSALLLKRLNLLGA